MIIAGIGTAVPPHRIGRADAAAIMKRFSCETAEHERLFDELYRRSGVETRGSVLLDASTGDLSERQSFFVDQSPSTSERMRKYEAEAQGLASASCRAAIAEAGVDPKTITHLITASCTGFHSPGFDISLIKQLRLDRDVARVHVGFMGCHALINATRVAKAFVEADGSARPLVCAVELCSLHHQYGWDANKIVSNALFADGSAAFVGVREGSEVCERVRRSSEPVYRLVETGSTLIDDSEDAMSWRIGDHGFEMTLSSRVPELIGRNLRPRLEAWLSSRSLSVDSIGSWAIHPGGPRILSAVAEAAGLDRSAIEPSLRVLAEHGNMSSPTILFILDRLRRSHAPRPCLALAFGPGLTIETALLN
jgi:prepilin-type processing-associated H-X9-DG protein